MQKWGIAGLVLLAAVTWAPAISLAASFFNVDTAGNVGIGITDSPQARLDVSGTIYSRLTTTTSSVDWNAGNVQTINLTNDQTLTFSNGHAGGEYKLIIKQDGTGGHTVTWPSTTMWPNNDTPSVSSGSNAIDVVSFVYDGSHYLGTIDRNFGGGVADCRGGTVSYSGGYTIRKFTSVGTSTLDCTSLVGSKSAAILVVAGGGGGGYGSGGGGAGGVMYDASRTISSNSYTITVGDGGNGAVGVDADSTTDGTNGGNSVFDAGGTPITAYGGGWGGSYLSSSQNGANGGSGGGASYSGTGGTANAGSGTGTGYAHAGGVGVAAGPGGGGGGAGAVGQNAPSTTQGGTGGDGVVDATVGNLLSAASAGVGGYIAGGGGAATWNDSTNTAAGGAGGGGTGGPNGSQTPGAANTGGGGGAVRYGTHPSGGGKGGSGIVIIKYLTP